MNQTVLIGDVGGTSIRFALGRRGPGGVEISEFEKISDPFDRFSDALAQYLERHDIRVERALFAIAGPVAEDGTVTMTNRPDWPTISPRDLQSRVGLTEVTLVNDFAAMARAIPEMKPEDFVEVLPGKPAVGAPIIVTGPGTGFGVSTLLPEHDGCWRPVTGQGGHTAYAPRSVREAEMAERIAAEHGYISTEMVVSGIWLQSVFDVISDMHGQSREKVSAGEILRRAEADDPVAREVCLVRACGIMGAAGDLVFINGGHGGVVLTGGVAERMVSWLKSPEAVRRFRERGTESYYVADVPVRVLMNHEAPLVGAAALLFDRIQRICA
ncbi:MAG: glucokinase [Hyphomonadaceae bacterium]|nr:glucokinase [Hyphomonadaceae bacterium]